MPDPLSVLCRLLAVANDGERVDTVSGKGVVEMDAVVVEGVLFG